MLAPLFVIGANRSGTSIVAQILAQHPQLEGLFSGPLEVVYDGRGHAGGHCESLHLWPSLAIPRGRLRQAQDYPFWGLPQHLVHTYRRSVRGIRERRSLIRAVERRRKTHRRPLINDHFNLLHVGLISDLFPDAHFILVTRSWQRFLGSGIHKWTHDRARLPVRLTPADPRGGMHWHLVNLIARYDLEIFAPGRHTELWLEEIQAGAEIARPLFLRLLEPLGLAPYEFDFSALESFRRKRMSDLLPSESPEGLFERVPEIVQHERALLKQALEPVPEQAQVLS